MRFGARLTRGVCIGVMMGACRVLIEFVKRAELNRASDRTTCADTATVRLGSAGPCTLC